MPSAKFDGLEIEYETFGASDAEPILLIMGLGSQMVGWTEDFCTRLAAAGGGHHVVRYDNRDTGLSTRFEGGEHDDVLGAMQAIAEGRPVRAPYLLGDMATDAAGLLEALGLSDAHIVGASMGGMIAQSLAIEFPERVRSLVSIMSTTGDPSLPPPTPAAMGALMKPPPASRDEAISQALEVWKTIGSPGFPFDEERIRRRTNESYDRGHYPEGGERQMVAITASPDRTEALGAVRAPTLVIHGEADPLVSIACGRATEAAIPGARGLYLEGMGHDLPVELYDELVEAIAEHAAGCSGEG